jgi:hypothetical protein
MNIFSWFRSIAPDEVKAAEVKALNRIFEKEVWVSSWETTKPHRGLATFKINGTDFNYQDFRIEMGGDLSIGPNTKSLKITIEEVE